MGKGQALLENSFGQLTVIQIASCKFSWILGERLFFLSLYYSEMIIIYYFFPIESITFIVLNQYFPFAMIKISI